MIIAKMRYDTEGDLLAPRNRDLEMTVVLPNQPATFDAGHWHRIKVAAPTRDALMRLLAPIGSRLGAIEGVVVTHEELTTMQRVDGRQQVVADLVYGIPAQR